MDLVAIMLILLVLYWKHCKKNRSKWTMRERLIRERQRWRLSILRHSWLCIFSSPQIPNSTFVSTFSFAFVSTLSRGEGRAHQHSIPIQFNPVSIHLSKWIDSMRIDADWMRFQCPVWTGLKKNAHECSTQRGEGNQRTTSRRHQLDSEYVR